MGTFQHNNRHFDIDEIAQYVDYIAIDSNIESIPMPISSEWPLSKKGIRFFVPQFAITALEHRPMTQSLFILAMGYYPHALAHTMSRQTHGEHLLMYCTDGEGTLSLHTHDPHRPAQEYAVKKGDLMVIPKSVSHQYCASNSAPWTIYWVHFDGDACEDYLSHISSTDPKIDMMHGGVLPIGIHSRMITDFEHLLSVRQTGYSLSAFIYASNVLGQLLSYIALLTPKISTDTHHAIDLDGIHDFMETHIDGQLDLEEIARFANLSKFHFSKRYKALTGYSPVQHFIHRKMEKACYLLDITEDPITSISYQLGYEDTQYFSRVFKRVIGLSPRDYRKSGG